MRNLLRGMIATAGLVLVGSTLAVAQTPAPQTFYACYVPNVGAVYLIKQTGLPTACLAASHVEIHWTEGSGGPVEIGNGSITSAKLADAAVTQPKLSAGAVGAAQIQVGSVGSSQIADFNVSSSDLANASVTTAKLAAPASITPVTLNSVSNLGTSLTTLGSITINAPAPGRVLLMLSGQALFFGDNTTAIVGFGSIPSSTGLYSLEFGRPDGTGLLQYQHSFAPFISVSVSTGANTFYVSAMKSASNSTNQVNLGSLRLVGFYTPN